MQTFLPYSNFTRSASCLDNKRLGKQRVECLQILNALLIPGRTGWRNHPAVRMWRGYEKCLCSYGLWICADWIGRGFKDTCMGKIEQLEKKYLIETWYGFPAWLGNEDFHLSHQSNLIRKLPEHYRPIFGDSVPDDLPYVWPL